MLGGLVNALWRPLQSIGQSIAHASRSPLKGAGQPNDDAHHPTAVDSTPVKQQQNGNTLDASAHQFQGDPFTTPVQSSQQQSTLQQPFNGAFIPTPSLTPLPKLLFKRSDLGARPRAQPASKANQAGPGRKNRFSVGADSLEDDDESEDVSMQEGRDEEDKENGGHTRKRPLATDNANGPDPLESETGHALKKPRTDFPSGITHSPRRTRKSGGTGLGSVPTASLFDFGPLQPQNKAPLFAHKPAKAKPAAGSKAQQSAASSSTAQQHQPMVAPSIALASSLGNFQISAPSTYPSQPGRSRGTSNVSMEDVPIDTDVVMQEESPRHHHANGNAQRAISPTHVLANPLSSLTITPQVVLPQNAFQGMSLKDAPAGNNPFQQQQPSNMNGHPAAAGAFTNGSSVESDRVRSQKVDRDSRKKDILTSLRQSRKQEEFAQEEKHQGHRGDIKARTKVPNGPINSAHVPLKATNNIAGLNGASKPVKPPVPLFWEQSNPQQQQQQPASASASSSFTPLVPDADFAMETEATRAAASSSSFTQPHFPARSNSGNSNVASSLPNKERVPLTQSASFRATLERDEARRRVREEQHAQAAKDAREKLLRERREAQAQAQAQAEAQQAAMLAQQQQQQQSDPSSSSRGIRRSARHSSSPSPSHHVNPSPSPSPPPETPSPRNRFVSPLAATPATPIVDPSMERRTRASMRASPSPPASSAAAAAAAAAATSNEVSQPSPRARAAQQAEYLAQSIATRKATEAAQAAQRIKERQANLAASERAADRAQKEKDEWRSVAARKVAQRARGKGYEGLLREFAPAIREEMSNIQAQQYEGLRKAMRKAMAKFHPDKHAGSPPRNQLEAEETFIVLKKAYDELTTLCR